MPVHFQVNEGIQRKIIVIVAVMLVMSEMLLLVRVIVQTDLHLIYT